MNELERRGLEHYLKDDKQIIKERLPFYSGYPFFEAPHETEIFLMNRIDSKYFHIISPSNEIMRDKVVNYHNRYVTYNPKEIQEVFNAILIREIVGHKYFFEMEDTYELTEENINDLYDNNIIAFTFCNTFISSKTKDDIKNFEILFDYKKKRNEEIILSKEENLLKEMARIKLTKDGELRPNDDIDFSLYIEKCYSLVDLFPTDLYYRLELVTALIDDTNLKNRSFAKAGKHLKIICNNKSYYNHLFLSIAEKFQLNKEWHEALKIYNSLDKDFKGHFPYHQERLEKGLEEVTKKINK